jgi:Acetolactate synthase, small (regulatory) subunit
VTLEITGDKGKMNACMEAFRPYGIIETAGSGQVALSRSGFVSEAFIEASFAGKK